MNEQHLFELIKIGNSIADTLDKKESQYEALLALIRIEKLLDTGRTLTTIDTGASLTHLAEINSGMDHIRSVIVSTVAKLDKKKIMDMLFSAGENMKLEFRPQ